jgi:hypothetical protein
MHVRLRHRLDGAMGILYCSSKVSISERKQLKILEFGAIEWLDLMIRIGILRVLKETTFT